MGFNEKKARELIKMLLNDDIIIFKKFLPDIEKMNSISFENLFNGNKNYNYSIQNLFDFKKLVDKFDNYHIIIEEWYDKPEYYCYIKELWLNYICIEDLRMRKNEIEILMENSGIKYRSWPQRIKEEFISLVSQTFNTIINKCKSLYKSLNEYWKMLLEQLSEFSSLCSHKNMKELGTLTDNYQAYIFSSLIGIEIPIYMISAIKKEILLNPLIDDFDMNTSLQKIKYYFENQNYLGRFKHIIEKKERYALYGLFSLYNIYGAISDYQEIKNLTKDIEPKIDFYKKRFHEIHESFGGHKKDLKNLNISQDVTASEVKNIFDNIKEGFIKDLTQLKNLMSEIEYNIQVLQKKKESCDTRAKNGIFQMGFGIIACYLTGGFAAFVYAFGSVTNGISYLISKLDINEINKSIKKYQDVLDICQKEKIQIEKQIDFIKDKIDEYISGMPKYFD